MRAPISQDEPYAIGVSEEGRENLLAWSTFVFNNCTS
jgi:hypothetical protein